VTDDGKRRIGAKDLGIDLSAGSDSEVFKWLVACDLFGARISQDIAARAFAELDKAGMLAPRMLADADWQQLVDLLGRGGYRRYDESTARELIEVGRRVLAEYNGSISRLPRGAHGQKEMSERLQAFPGVGPTAARIFLREMGGTWSA
jgi:endonuclease III